VQSRANSIHTVCLSPKRNFFSIRTDEMIPLAAESYNAVNEKYVKLTFASQAGRY